MTYAAQLTRGCLPRRAWRTRGDSIPTRARVWWSLRREGAACARLAYRWTTSVLLVKPAVCLLTPRYGLDLARSVGDVAVRNADMALLLFGVLSPAGALLAGAAISPTDRARNFWVLCGRDGVPPAGSLELCKGVEIRRDSLGIMNGFTCI